jgi:hypothetical protein
MTILLLCDDCMKKASAAASVITEAMRQPTPEKNLAQVQISKMHR